MPFSRTNIRKEFAVNKGVSIWNYLFTSDHECLSMTVFKKLIRNKFLSLYV